MAVLSPVSVFVITPFQGLMLLDFSIILMERFFNTSIGFFLQMQFCRLDSSSLLKKCLRNIQNISFVTVPFRSSLLKHDFFEEKHLVI